MLKYKAVMPQASTSESPAKLTKWINAYAEKNHMELIAIDGKCYIFKEVVFYVK